ncbi:MAG: anthranilate phosphoribosyltransferase [Planctomycetaceae bacterium]
MSNSILEATRIVLDGADLSADQMYAAVSQIMDGEAGEIAIASFLTALRVKGEATSELVGAARVMRERATKITTRKTGLLDTCGTGGDVLHTFNISTAAALVAAACGVPVAKHGNRSATSTSGSADVLEALGVRIDLPPERVAECIDEVGIGFCFAQLLHGAMKYAAPVRKQLGFRTIFNNLGPLTNPASAEFQLIGASRVSTADKLARALAELGVGRALVVCGAGELDEVSLWGETAVFEVSSDGVSLCGWSHETFELPSCQVEDLQVDSVAQSANIIRRILEGEKGPARNVVLANTAAALFAARHVVSPVEGVAAATAAIDTGKAAELVAQLVQWTNS